MENPQLKRLMHQPLTPQTSNPDVAALATLGMRIRKSIADGYSVSSQNSYNPHWSAQNTVGGLQTPQSERDTFNRQPLPSHMSQPPPLTNVGSTFQSGLNVSDWGLGPTHISTLPSMGTKRKHDDEPEYQFGIDASKQYGSYGAHKLESWEEFNGRQGQLKFNEDF